MGVVGAGGYGGVWEGKAGLHIPEQLGSKVGGRRGLSRSSLQNQHPFILMCHRSENHWKLAKARGGETKKK